MLGRKRFQRVSWASQLPYCNTEIPQNPSREVCGLTEFVLKWFVPLFKNYPVDPAIIIRKNGRFKSNNTWITKTLKPECLKSSLKETRP